VVTFRTVRRAVENSAQDDCPMLRYLLGNIARSASTNEYLPRLDPVRAACTSLEHFAAWSRLCKSRYAQVVDLDEAKKLTVADVVRAGDSDGSKVCVSTNNPLTRVRMKQITGTFLLWSLSLRHLRHSTGHTQTCLCLRAVFANDYVLSTPDALFQIWETTWLEFATAWERCRIHVSQYECVQGLEVLYRHPLALLRFRA
jgi:hypothetical protein